MSEYRFMNQLTEKEQIPTPAYVFDLDEMKEFAEKVKRCLTGKAEICPSQVQFCHETAMLQEFS